MLVSMGTQAWEKDKLYQITILHTNDHHGHFWQSEIGEYGLAAQKTVIDNIREEVKANDGILFVLSGGDINTGVPESDIQDAEPDFMGMNLIGYDAMAVGNHEFDNDISVIRQQQKWAIFPFLSANIYEKSTGIRVFEPYALFNQQDIKFAIIGLTTEDTPVISDIKYTQDFDFRLPAPEAKNVIEDLRQTQAPDITIAVTHMGHYDNGEHGSNAPGDVELARTLPAGYLNMIIGGHSQDPVCMVAENVKDANYVPGTECKPDQQNGTWIMQAHEWGKYVGRADFTFINGELTLNSYKLVPINLMKEVQDENGVGKLQYYTEQISQNQDMLELLTPYQEKGKEKLLIVVGSIDGRFEGERSKVRSEQTNLGELILASHIERTNADVGIVTGGMIRDSLIEGNITYRDILRVQPFANTVVYADMKGSELFDYLTVAANKSKGSGAYAQFANVSLVADGQNISDVKIKGEPLDLNKTYRLVTQNFIGLGGDGYPAINTLSTYVDTGFMEADVIKQYFEKHSPIKVSDFEPKGEIIYTE
ncbi:bifunctional UDP-sugar hydrolase/5'-nucleotidase UshA [Zophobihabitans entericus]|uniref:Bifunctional UDP-sugar hydrolase/5'-nucleotidase n=1 Tax=Zophobihabitans entericus TaxID=1635327 RepID=A0A6G9IDN3_9GAMM|nr:bifunctional UDP-sugar hydrolase/5'-nucleotidase [Zophobihabitans entericus]